MEINNETLNYMLFMRTEAYLATQMAEIKQVGLDVIKDIVSLVRYRTSKLYTCDMGFIICAPIYLFLAPIMLCFYYAIGKLLWIMRKICPNIKNAYESDIACIKRESLAIKLVNTHTLILNVPNESIRHAKIYGTKVYMYEACDNQPIYIAPHMLDRLRGQYAYINVSHCNGYAHEVTFSNKRV